MTSGTHLTPATTVGRLDREGVERLRGCLLEELGNSLLTGADADHVEDVLLLLRAVEQRRAPEAESPRPSLARRQALSRRGGRPAENR